MIKHILATWAEPASGPGWANTPIRCVIRNPDGSYSEHWFQPEEQTDLMRNLYQISAIVTNEMNKEAQRLLKIDNTGRI